MHSCQHSCNCTQKPKDLSLYWAKTRPRSVVLVDLWWSDLKCCALTLPYVEGADLQDES